MTKLMTGWIQYSSAFPNGWGRYDLLSKCGLLVACVWKWPENSKWDIYIPAIATDYEKGWYKQNFTVKGTLKDAMKWCDELIALRTEYKNDPKWNLML